MSVETRGPRTSEDGSWGGPSTWRTRRPSRYNRRVSFPHPDAFMPHRAPMLFVDRLLHHDGRRAVVEKTFRVDDPFVEDGKVSAFIALELFAQGAAAHFGYAALRSGILTSSGALLGTRGIDLEVPVLEVGRTLEVHVEQVLSMPPAAQYACRLLDAASGATLASGTINVALGPPRTAARSDGTSASGL